MEDPESQNSRDNIGETSIINEGIDIHEESASQGDIHFWTSMAFFTKKQMKSHLFTTPPGKKQHQPDVPVPAFSKMATRITNFPSCPSPLCPENANVAETETMWECCITCS